MNFVLWSLVLAGGVAIVVPAASAQQTRRTETGGRQRTHMMWSDDGRTVTVLLDGAVQFGDDDATVTGLDAGSTLTIEEKVRGEPSRRVEFRRDGSGIRRTWSVDGEVRSEDDDGRAWLARILPELIREQGFNAPARVERIYRAEGVDGVLREAGRIRSDGVKRAYLQLLLTHTSSLTAAQQVTALRMIERDIGSDGDKQRVLGALAPLVSLSDARARTAYFDAASSIGSDGDRHRVLLAILPRAGDDAPSLTALLRSAAGIGSDGDKSRVLIAATDAGALAAPAARDAWFAAAGGIGSDGDHSRALRAMLGTHGTEAQFAVRVLDSARRIGSDGDRTRVLLAVAAEPLRDPAVVEAYDAALAGIGSSGDRNRAADHLRSARR